MRVLSDSASLEPGLTHARQDGKQTTGESAQDTSRQVKRLYRASLRGFVIGLALKGGLQVVTVLAKFSKKQNPGSLSDRALDTLRWAAALGSFGAVYVGSDEAIRHFIGCQRSARFRSALAGAFAGPTILLTGLKARHDEIALYLLLRGITLLIRIGNKPSAPRAVHTLLRPTRWEHGDTALMCVSCWQLLSCYLMTPSTLPPSFIRFIDKLLGLPSWFVPLAREMARRKASGVSKCQPFSAADGTPYMGRTTLTMCDILHPERNGKVACDLHSLDIIPEIFTRSLWVYVPVYAASTLAVQRMAVLNHPLISGIKVAIGVARSSAFLTLAVALAHRSVCWANTLGGGRRGMTARYFQLFAWAPGLATLIEKKSRRMELAVYCACRVWQFRLVNWLYFAIYIVYILLQALLSLFNSAVQHSATPVWLSKVRTDVMALCFASASIMHCYSGSYGNHRDIFRSKYLNVLDFVFGCEGLDKGAVAHSVSNRQLLLTAAVTAHKATKATVRSLSAPNLLAGLGAG